MLNKSSLLSLVCAACGVEQARIFGKDRHRVFVMARGIYWYCCRIYLNCTLLDLAREAKKDHATVIHGINTVKDMLSIKDDQFTGILKAINDTIAARYGHEVSFQVFAPISADIQALIQCLKKDFGCRVLISKS